MTGRAPRRRDFAAKELDDIAGRLEMRAAELHAVAQNMKRSKVRTVSIDGATRPVIADDMLREFIAKAKLDLELTA